jgi:hypothetical protein
MRREADCGVRVGPTDGVTTSSAVSVIMILLMSLGRLTGETRDVVEYSRGSYAWVDDAETTWHLSRLSVTSV